MIKTAQETKEFVQSKIEGCFKEESKFGVFVSLGQLAQNTSSNSEIPEHLKEFWIKKIEGLQMNLSDNLIQEL